MIAASFIIDKGGSMHILVFLTVTIFLLFNVRYSITVLSHCRCSSSASFVHL